jgi:hypothetical protein
MRSFITLHQVLLERSSRGDWNGQGMQNAWRGGREKNAYRIFVGKPEEKKKLERLRS